MQFHYRIEAVFPATEYTAEEGVCAVHYRIETIILGTQYTTEGDVCAVSLQSRDHNSSYTVYCRGRGMCSFITE